MGQHFKTHHANIKGRSIIISSIRRAMEVQIINERIMVTLKGVELISKESNCGWAVMKRQSIKTHTNCSYGILMGGEALNPYGWL